MADAKQVKEKADDKKLVYFVDPFTGRKAANPVEVIENFDDVENPDIIGLELDKETGLTKVVSTGKRHLNAEIQEFKDQCGFEGMKVLIQQGRATPKDFYDDGNHGQDVAGLPDNVHDAYRAALASSRQSGNLFKDLGIKPVFNRDGSIDQEATEQLLTEAIQKKFESVKPNEVNDNAETK